jgi:MATE family multidrug resistance protein
MALTRHDEGSLKELWTIALPLMFTTLSVMVMIFVDRLLLAWYSTDALNAATNATTLGWALQFGWVALASICEVFVAQYNGAQDYKKIGSAVWQSLWLCALSVLFFLPLALWGGDWIYQDTSFGRMEKDYFNIMMLLGPVPALNAALCGFWIGRGKTALVATMAVIANVINVVLDMIFIFGVDGWVPSMGVKGAAIATSVGMSSQVVVLAILFLRKCHRDQFGTGEWMLRWRLLVQTVKVGIPNSIFAVVEMMGWAAFYGTMTMMGPDYITVTAVCQSIAILLWFLPDALNKAVISIAGNMIGAGTTHNIGKLIRSGVLFNVLFLMGMMMAILPFTDFWMGQFLDQGHQHNLLLRDALTYGLIMVIVHVFFEGIKMTFLGVLTAAGDTLFTFLSGSVMIWLMMYLPVYVLVVQWHGSIEVAMTVWAVFSMIGSAVYFLRLRWGSWQKLAVAG